MLDFIMIPSIVGIITLGIYKLFELFARRRERLALIEKLAELPALPTSEVMKQPILFSQESSFSALKGGCLFAGFGLGLLVAFFICYTHIPGYGSNNDWALRDVLTVIYGACTLLFGGAGLIVAFIIEQRIKEKK